MSRVINHIYECDVCGKRGVWGDEWWWYCSLDDPKNMIVVLCSDKCRAEFQANGKKRKK